MHRLTGQYIQISMVGIGMHGCISMSEVGQHWMISRLMVLGACWIERAHGWVLLFWEAPLERLFLVIHLKDASFKWICIWLSELLGFKHIDPFSQGQERSKVEWRTGGGMSDSLTVGPKGLGDLAHLNGKLLYLPWHGSVKVTAPPLTG